MRFLLCAGLILWAGLGWAVASQSGPGLLDIDCEPGLPSDEYRCAEYHTNDGHRLRVVIVLPAYGPKLEDSHPLLFIHGGPGYPFNLDVNGARYWGGWVSRLGMSQPVVLFDQRGSGQSVPRYSCPEYDAAGLQVLSASMPASREFDIWQDATAGCRARIAGSGFNAADYSSEKTAADAAGIMAAMAVKDWDVFAVSYGTRVALHLMAANPSGLDAVVMDSVLPLDRSPLDELPWLYGGSLQRLFDACKADSKCNDMLPHPEQRLLGLLAKLQAEPVRISVPGPSAAPITVMVDDLLLVEALFHSLYSMDAIRGFPAILEAAASGRVAALQPVIANLARWMFDTELSDPVYYAVACNERDPVAGPRRFSAGLQAYPGFAPWLRMAQDYDLCRAWGYDPAPRRPPPQFDGPRPVAILSGGYDPVTPIDWAREVSRQIPGAVLYESPQDSHIVLESNACASTWVAGFLRDHGQKRLPDCASKSNAVNFRIPDELLTD